MHRVERKSTLGAGSHFLSSVLKRSDMYRKIWEANISSCAAQFLKALKRALSWGDRKTFAEVCSILTGEILRPDFFLEKQT